MPYTASPRGFEAAISALMANGRVDPECRDSLRERLTLTFYLKVEMATEGARTKDRHKYNLAGARQSYQKALSQGSHFYLIFALCVSPRLCKDKKKIHQLSKGVELPPEFSLSKSTTDLLIKWADEDGYANIEAFQELLAGFTTPCDNASPTKQIARIKAFIDRNGTTGIPQDILDILGSNCSHNKSDQDITGIDSSSPQD